MQGLPDRVGELSGERSEYERRALKNPSELVSQATMGSVVKVLRENSGWYYLQTSDKYLGWMKDESFVRCSKSEADAWIAARKVIVLSTYETVRQDAHAHSYPVCDLVAGSLLKKYWLAQALGQWSNCRMEEKVLFRPPALQITNRGKKIRSRRPMELKKQRGRFLVYPYLWGGTSTKAMDCSGFTKTVYLMNGMQLNRDAYQQAEQGIEIVPGEKFQNLRKGDLLFFGRKAREDAPAEILHVALYLKDRSFIHSSGMVKINSLDPASPVFDAGKIKSFICARRIIPISPAVPEVAFRR